MIAASLEDLTPADTFQRRTPRNIAQAIEAREGGGSLDYREQEARKVAHPLTPLQIQMIDNELFRPHSTMWSNMHFWAQFDCSEVDPDRLCMAVNSALNNHPALSSAFFFDDQNNLMQQYIPGLLPEVKVREISKKMEDILPNVLLLPYDRILNACLCRVRLFCSPEYLYLFFDAHHVLLDGGSPGILFSDIVNAYQGERIENRLLFCPQGGGKPSHHQ